MNIERDKFLTEVMGITYLEKHRLVDLGNNLLCTTDSWAFFGALWEWATKQEWWPTFFCYLFKTKPYDAVIEVFGCFVNPNHFANALYEFLKEKEVP